MIYGLFTQQFRRQPLLHKQSVWLACDLVQGFLPITSNGAQTRKHTPIYTPPIPTHLPHQKHRCSPCSQYPLGDIVLKPVSEEDSDPVDFTGDLQVVQLSTSNVPDLFPSWVCRPFELQSKWRVSKWFVPATRWWLQIMCEPEFSSTQLPLGGLWPVPPWRSGVGSGGKCWKILSDSLSFGWGSDPWMSGGGVVKKTTSGWVRWSQA